MNFEMLKRDVRKLAREIAPDYPGIDDENSLLSECLWAIKEGYRGLKLANDDLHELVRLLRQKFNLTPEEVLDIMSTSKGPKSS